MRRHDQIKQAIEKAHGNLAEIEEAEALRIGRLAVDAGLADIRVKNSDLKREFAVLAKTFPARSGLGVLQARKIAKAHKTHG